MESNDIVIQTAYKVIEAMQTKKLVSEDFIGNYDNGFFMGINKDIYFKAKFSNNRYIIYLIKKNDNYYEVIRLEVDKDKKILDAKYNKYISKDGLFDYYNSIVNKANYYKYQNNKNNKLI